MDAVLEQWYSKNLDEDIQKKRIDFLDNFELDLAKKLADKVLIGLHVMFLDLMPMFPSWCRIMWIDYCKGKRSLHLILYTHFVFSSI